MSLVAQELYGSSPCLDCGLQAHHSCSSLLVCASGCCLLHADCAVSVLQAGASQVSVTLPAGAIWFEALAGGAITPTKAGKPLSTAVHLDAIPVFYKGGHIVPRR